MSTRIWLWKGIFNTDTPSCVSATCYILITWEEKGNNGVWNRIEVGDVILVNIQICSANERKWYYWLVLDFSFKAVSEYIVCTSSIHFSFCIENILLLTLSTLIPVVTFYSLAQIHQPEKLPKCYFYKAAWKLWSRKTKGKIHLFFDQSWVWLHNVLFTLKPTAFCTFIRMKIFKDDFSHCNCCKMLSAKLVRNLCYLLSIFAWIQSVFLPTM